MRKAFLPAVVSTSGRIHGDLLRLLYLLADNKTKRHFRALDEAIDVDSEAYCWRRSGSSGVCGLPSAWRVLRPQPCPLRFSAKATRGPAPGALVFEPLHLTPDSGSLSPPRISLSFLSCLFLSFCVCRPEVTVTSLHPPRLCRLAVFSIKPAKPTLLSQEVSLTRRALF